MGLYVYGYRIFVYLFVFLWNIIVYYFILGYLVWDYLCFYIGGRGRVFFSVLLEWLVELFLFVDEFVCCRDWYLYCFYFYIYKI